MFAETRGLIRDGAPPAEVRAKLVELRGLVDDAERRLTDVGVGAYWAGNVLYVTEVFRLPERTSAPVVRTVSVPVPRPAPAPRVVVRSAAPATPAPTAPAVTTPPPTVAAPASSTSTSLVAAAAPQWPSAALDTQRAASHGPAGTSVPAVAVVAALLLMVVAGLEVSALRRRAERA